MRVSRLVTHADTVNAASSTTALLALPFTGLRLLTLVFFFFFKVIFPSKFFSANPSQTLALGGAGGGKVAKLKLKGIDGSRPPEDFSKQQARARRPRSQGLVPVSVYRRSRPDHPRNYSKFFSANPSHVP